MRHVSIESTLLLFLLMQNFLGILQKLVSTGVLQYRFLKNLLQFSGKHQSLSACLIKMQVLNQIINLKRTVLCMFSGNFVTFYRVPFLETIDPNFRPAVKMKMNFFSENQLNGLHWFLYKRNICLRRRCFVCISSVLRKYE